MFYFLSPDFSSIPVRLSVPIRQLRPKQKGVMTKGEASASISSSSWTVLNALGAVIYFAGPHARLSKLLALSSLVLELTDGIPAVAFDSFEHRYLGNTTFEIVSKLMEDTK